MIQKLKRWLFGPEPYIKVEHGGLWVRIGYRRPLSPDFLSSTESRKGRG